MALKRALVVDDSRSARAALSKLLEEHELEVAEADSGESALEYLARESVDVVFMDHTMPGMDGLEAVSAIKANPATATIPVMMYTTKEGEVYVGQARALGAVGVLPKTVQPHQLFEMLLHLGLVHDRRSDNAETSEPIDLTAVADEVDRALDNQAMGMSVQALVSRILEDQHLTLRSDILRSQKTFAREVAHQILKEQALSPEAGGVDIDPDSDEPNTAGKPSNGRTWLSVAAVITAFVCAFLAWQFKNERDTAFQELVEAETSRSASSVAQINELRNSLDGAQSLTDDATSTALAGIAAALSMGDSVEMGADAFTGALAVRLSQLLPYVESLGYTGAVTLTSHLGQFCLVVDELGSYQLAPADALLVDCDYMGNIQEDNGYASDRLSVEFSEFLQAREGRAPEINLVALTLGESTAAFPYPLRAATAGEWNAVAAANNRVEVSFE